MQSELLSQIHGLFSGKCHRRTQATITTLQVREIHGGTNLFSDRFKDNFRRKWDNPSETHEKKHKQDGGEPSAGKNVFRVGNIGFKLNLKRINFSVSPPAVPTRHFSIDDDRVDLPPPIPERKCSLDTSVNEEFQGRFLFRPMSLAPLPGGFSNCNKLYPSQTPRGRAFQRPPSQPPPPPPPMEYSPSPTDITFHLPLPDVTSLPPPLTDMDTQSPVVLPVVGNGPKIPGKISQPILVNNLPNDNPNLPPPPMRKVPPPPPTLATKNMKLSPFRVAPISPHSTISSKISPKQNGSQPPTTLHLRIQTRANSDPDLITDLNQSSSSTQPRSPPAPPLPVRPGVPHSATKPKIVNGSQNRIFLKPTQNNNPSVPPSLPAHVVMKYKELPQLPVKVPQKNKTPLESNTFSSLPQSTLSSNKNAVHSFPPRPLLSLPEHAPPPPFKQPLQAPETTPPPFRSPPSLRPQPDLVTSVSHPNKRRPLPSIPVAPLAKNVQASKVNDGWGGAEVFDPREEEGDIYDVMDSTDM